MLSSSIKVYTHTYFSERVTLSQAPSCHRIKQPQWSILIIPQPTAPQPDSLKKPAHGGNLKTTPRPSAKGKAPHIPLGILKGEYHHQPFDFIQVLRLFYS
ncbi:hypothetical protein [Bartonella sp. B1098]|uniref:hypothetical protein n=1 Tax=Bartonella sp. B1098 TaxID=2911421 RepID=UPI0020C22B6F|nr:hypothetical protein [Bartonella sp. B1098]